MKRIMLISFAMAALLAPGLAHAGTKTYTLLLAGGEEANMIRIWLSPDGREYVIDSVVQLEVGGSVCRHPEDNEYELVCDAPAIAGFEVNAGGGDDRVGVAKDVTVPVTMRGGAGNDFLLGGAAADKLIGGNGNDRLVGWRGADLLYGGPGDDTLLGGPGDDLLSGGPGIDRLGGGPGRDELRQHRRHPAAAG
jgi:RTX calcium-binding nonapeptide repeat (4 copies)